MSKWMDNLLPKFLFDDPNSGYRSGDKFWKASTLYAAVKDQKCKPYQLPLRFLDLSDYRWESKRIPDMVFSIRRVMNSDLSIPIIISPAGGILDGYHRIAKALLEGREYVMAYRLLDMPEPDDVDKEDE